MKAGKESPSAIAELCSEEPAWFCVRSQLKHEHIAAAHLERLPGVEVFNPRLRLLRSTRRGRRWSTEPLFPGYLFARFAPHTTLEKVRYSPGVKLVLKFGDRLPTIPDGVIADLRKGLAALSGQVLVDAPLEGEEVEVALGAFAGVKGPVTRVLPGKQRVEVLLEVMGRSVAAELNLDYVLFNRKPAAGLVLNRAQPVPDVPPPARLSRGAGRLPRLLGPLLVGSWLWQGATVQGQVQESLAGEQVAQALKKSITAEPYNISYGPLKFQTESSVILGYTDNVFLSNTGRQQDMLVKPEVDLRTLWPISELNTLKLSLGIGYEWYLNEKSLNSNLPLFNPNSDLAFNLFVGDFRFRFYDRFSYQETLFFNSVPGPSGQFFNLHDVGLFKRWDNQAGVDMTWDLNKYLITANFYQENFLPNTAQFDYLQRSSQWLTASAGRRLGDKFLSGVESAASLHDYASQTTLNDNWRVRGGPFVEFTSPQKITVRAGMGYDTAQFDASAAPNSDYQSYYAYGKIQQETRLFTHQLVAGREYTLGVNANNLRTVYVRYAITTASFNHFDLGADISVDFAEEFGGSYQEKFIYPVAGVRVGYQFHKYLRTDLKYQFILKDSDLPGFSYYVDRVTWGLTFLF